MKRLLLILCISSGSYCFAQSNDGLNQFAWLAGEWQRTGMKPGKVAYESWSMEGDLLSGRGISLENGDTTFVEKLNICFLDGAFYYIADVPQNAEPTKFKVTEVGDGYFKASNPEHDFPKEIRYELKEGQLLAEISGDGQSMRFIFKKLR